MSILMACGEGLDNCLCNLRQNVAPSKELDNRESYFRSPFVSNIKIHIFNLCTATLIASVALGCFSKISSESASILGLASLFGRWVADASFDAVNPSIVNFLGVGSYVKPTAWFEFCNVVFFYNIIPNNLDEWQLLAAGKNIYKKWY